MSQIQDFDFSVDLLRALLWQYDNAEKLQSLLRQKAAWYTEQETVFWEAWRRDVFDLTTANEFGCAVWAIILNVPLSVSLEQSGDRDVFGFGQYHLNFDNGNFGRTSAGVASLTLEQCRTLLRLRYFNLTSDGSVPYTNYILKKVFGGGHVLDGLNMTITYVLPLAIQQELLTLMIEYDLLPRPAGVGYRLLVDVDDIFGFGDNFVNFDNGPFGE